MYMLCPSTHIRFSYPLTQSSTECNQGFCFNYTEHELWSGNSPVRTPAAPWRLIRVKMELPTRGRFLWIKEHLDSTRQPLPFESAPLAPEGEDVTASIHFSRSFLTTLVLFLWIHLLQLSFLSPTFMFSTIYCKLNKHKACMQTK